MSVGTLAPPERTAQRRDRVLRAVASFEGKKIWRHPALLLAVIITAYELYQQVDWSSAPVLNRDSYTSAWPMIIYAAGVYLAIGMTVNRRHGAQDDETMDALPVTPLTRIMGTGLAFISPLLVAVVMQGTVLAVRAVNGPVTSIVWAEALVGPATVALAAAAGTAVGWVFKSPLAVPLAGLVFLVAVLVVWWEDFIFGFYTPWLAPVPSLDRNQYAFEQVFRPSELHLLYLGLVALFFVVVATVRGRSRRDRMFSFAGSLLLLAGVVWVGSAQLTGLTAAEEEEWESQYLPTTGDYSCEQRAAVTYCAYAGYEPWIDEWAGEVEPVLDLVPDDVAASPLEIRQQIPYFVDEDELEPSGDLTAGMWWSRSAYGSPLVPHRLGMALGAAGWAVGLPTRDLAVSVGNGDSVEPFDPATDDADQLRFRACRPDGQARAVAALWYAVQSSPESREALEFQVSGERFGGLDPQDNVPIDIGFRQPSSSVEYFRREAMVALEMDQLPRSDVASTLSEHWEELIEPETTTEDIAGWFGVEVPEMGPAFQSGAPCP